MLSPLWGAFGTQVDSWSCICTVYYVTLREILFTFITKLSTSMDRKRVPEHACHVIDSMSLNNALLHFQQVVKHLLDMENIVTDGFQALRPLAYPAGVTVGSVRVLRQHRIESGPADIVGWSVMQLVHIID